MAVKKLDASTEVTGKQMISALKQSLQVEKVARKQNLANLTWDILSSLGETFVSDNYVQFFQQQLNLRHIFVLKYL